MSNNNFQEKIATPYAEALLDYAQSIDVLKQATNELSYISLIISQSNDLNSFLLNPMINNEIKKEVLEKLFKNQVHDFILKFLLILVDKRRISLLDIIIKKYLELTYLVDSVIIAEFYSVVDISESQQNDLISKIKAITNSKTVKLVLNKDPKLIGGFIIKIGSKVIDASLLGKLKSMSLYLNTK